VFSAFYGPVWSGVVCSATRSHDAGQTMSEGPARSRRYQNIQRQSGSGPPTSDGPCHCRWSCPLLMSLLSRWRCDIISWADACAPTSAQLHMGAVRREPCWPSRGRAEAINLPNHWTERGGAASHDCHRTRSPWSGPARSPVEKRGAFDASGRRLSSTGSAQEILGPIGDDERPPCMTAFAAEGIRPNAEPMMKTRPASRGAS
jgi:hypothetical protein